MNIKHIQKFLDEIQWLFSVNNFERDIILKEKDEENIAAQVTYESNYQRITIELYPLFFKKSKEDQRKMLLHELCHTITIPLKRMSFQLLNGQLVTQEHVKEAEEEATSKIENILDGLLQDRLKYSKQAYKNYLNENKNTSLSKTRKNKKEKN